MATYKVIQDVEAEDKFIGPLTFKQFLFAGAACVLGYIMFLFATTGLIYLSIPVLPIFLGLVALTIPWSKDQPTELFLASRIRFLFMKRKRIWDQSGVKDLVQITVPKKEVHIYTDGLTQDQVKSRLSALSDVVDSRGWVVKNLANNPTSDRLVQAAPVLKPVEVNDAKNTEDVFDSTSTESTQIDTMIKKSEDDHRKQTLALVEEARAKSKQLNKSVLNEPTQQQTQAPKVEPAKQVEISQKTTPVSDPMLDSISLPNVDPRLTQMKSPQPTAATKPQAPIMKKPIVTRDEEEALLNQIHRKQETEEILGRQTHMKVVQPLSAQTAQQTQTNQPQNIASDDAQTPTQPTVNPAILSLAQNDDRSVESLAREANKKDLSDDEVVISLR